jgi:hypothetical protein
MEEDKEILIKLLTYFDDYGPTSDFGGILVNVSRKVFDIHMGKLIQFGMILIVKQPNGSVYVTTEKGRDYLLELTA